MPRSGSGVYTLPAPAPFQNGTTIDAPAMNTVQTDIAAALTASTAADGQTPITGSWNWGGYSISNLATMTTTGAATVGTVLTVGNGATVTKGGLTVTAGGLTVSAGGMAVIGNSAISGTLGIADAVLVSKGGVTVTAGGVIVAADGATITGNSTVTGTLTVTSTATAANGTTGTQLVNYSQFPATLATPGTATLPNGLILKWGSGTYTAGSGTVAYASAFPTATLEAFVTLATSGAAHTSYPPGPDRGTYATTGFTVYGGTGQSGSFTWWAVGH